MKQKRRTLKNRGYALNCRVRRLQIQLQLEAENVMLKNEVNYLRQVVQEAQHKISYYDRMAAANQANQVNQAPVTFSPGSQQEDYFNSSCHNNDSNATYLIPQPDQYYTNPNTA